ncbi:hypothetical protein HPP92_015201 [Vanilla planifolia]|uniref:Uncharacterized protein n=1 Tax=Vanilla planifolia TaxID=51239 RepID=A0A835QSG4_VANPL|nr:hypothetical protein HPP92_015201 [Vanilla planifolia]
MASMKGHRTTQHRHQMSKKQRGKTERKRENFGNLRLLLGGHREVADDERSGRSTESGKDFITFIFRHAGVGEEGFCLVGKRKERRREKGRRNG